MSRREQAQPTAMQKKPLSVEIEEAVEVEIEEAVTVEVDGSLYV